MTKFQGPAKLQELLDFRQDWASLHKLDQDTMLFDRVKAILDEPRDEGAPAHWEILGTRVCLKAWKRLQAVGALSSV